MKNNEFITGVEKLVNPVDVGTLHFIQSFNNMIPLKTQKKMVAKSGAKTPYMGFVVEPYSYFLCYELKDLEMAQKLLPEGFKLAKSKVFEDDVPRYYGIFGCFNAHTSGFWGLRLEFYIIAEDQNTGMLSWIIIDYDTNTITYDPKNGLSDPNAEGSIMTIDYDGVIYANVKNMNGRQMKFRADIKDGVTEPLANRLWIEGNLSIAYGGNKLGADAGLFSLIFDPSEFKTALRLPKNSLELEVNNWFPGLFYDEPAEVACFPYAQHFLSDSPGHFSLLKDEEELVEAKTTMDFSKLSVFSTKPFKKSFLVGGVVSVAVNLVWMTLYILK
jgi:hypothetical protein